MARGSAVKRDSAPGASPPSLPPAPTPDELEWKAAWWYERDKQRILSEGKHPPEKHLNAFEVAPPRRDDGTFCSLCDKNVSKPYSALTEGQKEWYRQTVAASKVCEDDYQRTKVKA